MPHPEYPRSGQVAVALAAALGLKDWPLTSVVIKDGVDEPATATVTFLLTREQADRLDRLTGADGRTT